MLVYISPEKVIQDMSMQDCEPWKKYNKLLFKQYPSDFCVKVSKDRTERPVSNALW